MVCIQQTKYAPTWDLVWRILRLITSSTTHFWIENIARHGRRWKRELWRKSVESFVSAALRRRIYCGMRMAKEANERETFRFPKKLFFLLPSEVGNNLSIFFKTDCWTISNRHIFSARRLCGEKCRDLQNRERSEMGKVGMAESQFYHQIELAGWVEQFEELFSLTKYLKSSQHWIMVIGLNDWMMRNVEKFKWNAVLG